jgi:hypothetical protein
MLVWLLGLVRNSEALVDVITTEAPIVSGEGEGHETVRGVRVDTDAETAIGTAMAGTRR